MKILATLVMVSLILACLPVAMAHEEKTGITADQAMKNLMEGNTRFASGNSIHPDQSIADRRAELVTSQPPFAIMVTCSDSRIPPEIVFDQGLGISSWSGPLVKSWITSPWGRTVPSKKWSIPESSHIVLT